MVERADDELRQGTVELAVLVGQAIGNETRRVGVHLFAHAQAFLNLKFAPVKRSGDLIPANVVHRIPPVILRQAARCGFSAPSLISIQASRALVGRALLEQVYRFESYPQLVPQERIELSTSPLPRAQSAISCGRAGQRLAQF